MRLALRAEWTKLRTEGGTGWLLLAIIVLTVALSVLTAVATRCPPDGCSQDVTKLSLTGVDLGQAIVAIVAVLAIGGEYNTGMIRTTLTAMPRRSAVLTAKAVIVTGLAVAAGAIAVLASLLAARFILTGNGFTAAQGYPPLSLTDGPTLRATLGSILYLALIALLSLGIATAVRDSAAAIGSVLGLLYLFPIIAEVVADPDWQRRLQQISPMNAGLAIQSTVALKDLPIGPWKGIGVLTAWAAAALLIGALLLHRRDA